MEPSIIKTMMIRAAVKKGINDAIESPRRGIRNLVELGETLAGGPFQREFLHSVLAQLKDESSAYFHIVTEITRRVSPEALTDFGISLGYNSLSHGASIIRNIEASEGFNVPWCLLIDPSNRGELPPSDISRIIRQGKQLGIYCYLIHIDSSYGYREKLLQMLSSEKQCAFVLFCDHNIVDSAFCRALPRIRNAAVLLKLGDYDTVHEAADRLLATGNLCGAFCSDAGSEDFGAPSKILERAEALGLPITVFIRTKKHRLSGTNGVYRQFVYIREHLEVPVLPIDLYDDIAHADAIISSEACIVSIWGDGTMALKRADTEGETCSFSIHETSLREALSRAMPKTA